MPQRPPDVTPEILQGDLSEELLQTYLAGADLAVDTETMGLQTRRDRLCLIQLCDREGRAASCRSPASRSTGRPAAGRRAPRLKRAHGGRRASSRSSTSRASTWPLCDHWLGHRVTPPLLHAHREQAGAHLHRPPRPQGQPARVPRRRARQGRPATRDWSSPRLSPEQVRYAISDVTLLLPLMDRLEEMLVPRGPRRTWPASASASSPRWPSSTSLGFEPALRALKPFVGGDVRPTDPPALRERAASVLRVASRRRGTDKVLRSPRARPGPVQADRPAGARPPSPASHVEQPLHLARVRDFELRRAATSWRESSWQWARIGPLPATRAPPLSRRHSVRCSGREGDAGAALHPVGRPAVVTGSPRRRGRPRRAGSR